MWDFSRLPLVGGGAFPGGGIFSRNYEEFSTGVDIPPNSVKKLGAETGGRNQHGFGSGRLSLDACRTRPVRGKGRAHLSLYEHQSYWTLFRLSCGPGIRRGQS